MEVPKGVWEYAFPEQNKYNPVIGMPIPRDREVTFPFSLPLVMPQQIPGHFVA